MAHFKSSQHDTVDSKGFGLTLEFTSKKRC